MDSWARSSTWVADRVGQHAAEARWEQRSGWARLLRAAVFCTPVLASFAAALAVPACFPRRSDTRSRCHPRRPARVSTLTLIAVDSLSRRAPPTRDAARPEHALPEPRPVTDRHGARRDPSASGRGTAAEGAGGRGRSWRCGPHTALRWLRPSFRGSASGEQWSWSTTRYDGRGYPAGLSGQQISLGARIVAVADAYDVMTAARAYRRPVSRAAACRELVRYAGTQFDPHVVRAMVAAGAPRLCRAQGIVAFIADIPLVASGVVPAATVARVVGAGALATGAVTGGAVVTDSLNLIPRPEAAVAAMDSTSARDASSRQIPTARGQGGRLEHKNKAKALKREERQAKLAGKTERKADRRGGNGKQGTSRAGRAEAPVGAADTMKKKSVPGRTKKQKESVSATVESPTVESPAPVESPASSAGPVG